MYSGSDSTGSQNINQWPLNPAAYQNTPNEQIDWAALAQQWIIMKEAGPPVPEQISAPIQPPLIQKMKKENLSEGGEAPMEVENDKEDDGQPLWNDNAASDGSWTWNQQQNQQQWGWNNTWSAPAGVPPPCAAKAPLLPTPSSYSQYSPGNDSSNNFGNFSRPPPNDYPGGYWNASGNKVKPHNKRFSKVNMTARPPIAAPDPDPVMLDATKRKQLPAWIREGLEKMERDKQKQLEREREMLEKEDHVERSKLDEKEALEIIKSTVKEREKSRFDSDGEESIQEVSTKETVSVQPEPILLTHEQLMLKLRRTMTEILLKVTNQEIRAVCKEEFQRLIRKHKASDQHVAASSGTNIGAKLGLGIYGGSESSSDDSIDGLERTNDDSDMELKDTIKRRKAEFSRTEREIENRLAAAEKHTDDDSCGGTPKVDDSDSQVDAKSQGYKTKFEDDTLRNVASKNVKSRRLSSGSSTKSDLGYDKHSKDKHSSRSKRSSSSDSSRDHKSHSRNKQISSSKRSRSITPERKRIKDKSKHNNDRKIKHSESANSKSSSSRSRKTRSKSIESRKRRSRSSDRYHRSSKKAKNSYSRYSRSRSSSRSRRSRSYTRSRRSESRGTSRSYTKSEKSRRSRSPARTEVSYSRSDNRLEKSRRSRSRDQRSSSRSRRSRSRQRSRSSSLHSYRYRRSKSRSSSRGKRSHRH